MGQNSRERFLAACRGRNSGGPPAWVMRQAGRYLPEYRAVREKSEFLDMVHDPELAAEVTMQPIRRFDMDAAVIFSDILVPPAAMGMGLTFKEGEGPRLAPPVRTRADVEALRDFDAEDRAGFLAEALALVRGELGAEKALIGFCGAPWTVASYMIEGGGSRNFENAKQMLYGDRATFDLLIERIVENQTGYLRMQVESGADVVQIFDSWGGALDARTWRDACLPAVKRLVEAGRAAGAPVILYVNGGDHLLEVLAEAEPDVIGVDWRVRLSDARRRVGRGFALQGNLDPCVLFAGPAIVASEVNRLLDEFADDPGWIFNLGSGILPKTPVESMAALFSTLRARR